MLLNFAYVDIFLLHSVQDIYIQILRGELYGVDIELLPEILIKAKWLRRNPPGRGQSCNVEVEAKVARKIRITSRSVGFDDGSELYNFYGSL